jgi:hypothetical protein
MTFSSRTTTKIPMSSATTRWSFAMVLQRGSKIRGLSITRTVTRLRARTETFVSRPLDSPLSRSLGRRRNDKHRDTFLCWLVVPFTIRYDTGIFKLGRFIGNPTFVRNSRRCSPYTLLRNRFVFCRLENTKRSAQHNAKD